METPPSRRPVRWRLASLAYLPALMVWLGLMGLTSVGNMLDDLEGADPDLQADMALGFFVGNVVFSTFVTLLLPVGLSLLLALPIGLAKGRHTGERTGHQVFLGTSLLLALLISLPVLLSAR